MLPTPRQLQVLKAYDEFVAEHGYAPTYRELAKKLGVGYTAVSSMFDRLAARGIVRNTGKARGIVRILPAQAA